MDYCKKLLIAFPSSYLVEQEFSAVTDLNTKKEIGSISSKEDIYVSISQGLNETLYGFESPTQLITIIQNNLNYPSKLCLNIIFTLYIFITHL